MSTQVVVTLDQADATRVGNLLGGLAGATAFELESISLVVSQEARDSLQRVSDALLEPRETGKTSDGYHTFDELYDHRARLFLALAYAIAVRRSCHVWRSRLHSDGTSFDNWFIMGIGKNAGEQIAYHLPNTRWGEAAFAQTLDRAPAFDGHTSQDVLARLRKMYP